MPTVSHKSRKSALSEISLTQEEFDTLEELGGVTLSDEIRAGINDTISLVIGGPWKRPTNQPHDEKKQQLLKLQASLAQSMRNLREVEGTDMPGRDGSMLERWRATIPVDANIAGEGDVLSYFERTFAMLHEATECGLKELGSKPVTSGRPENQRLRYFIVSLAETYARAGGKPSTAYQDSLGHRDTPFLRVLCFIHQRLPSPRRGQSEDALKEMAHRVIGDHNTAREKRGRSRLGTRRPRKGQNVDRRDR